MSWGSFALGFYAGLCAVNLYSVYISGEMMGSRARGWNTLGRMLVIVFLPAYAQVAGYRLMSRMVRDGRIR